MRLGFIVHTWQEGTDWVATAELPGSEGETTAHGAGRGTTKEFAVAGALRALAEALDPTEQGKIDA